jgi:lysophospholipid acyltransferase (LPLAT)-like uncharacterized protein
MLKKFLKSETGQGLAARLAAGYIAFVYRTTRWTIVGAPPEGAFIGCFWHQRMLLLPPIWRARRNLHMLISSHRDGVLISKTIARFGVPTIVGSTNRGASDALRGLIATLKRGECVAVTPDGPRGPARQAAQGVAAASFLARAPVVPTSYSVSRAKFLRSWDRFLIPLPFGRGAMIWGEPLAPPNSRDGIEALTAALQARLDALCVEADRMTGLDKTGLAP